MQFERLASIIIGLKNADLQLRQSLILNGELNEAYNKEMEKLHNHNAETLNKIIDKIAYPTIDKVGKEASNAAWLIIQHAVGKPDFMKKCLKLLELAVGQNKANPQNLAYLSDRIAVLEDRKQCYGTQFDWDENGVLSPNPIDDIKKVNLRRASIGLNTVQEQTKVLRAQQNKDGLQPPTDLAKRNADFVKWKKAKGWTN